MKDQDTRWPDFDFAIPAGYSWMLEKGLIGFSESPLRPWYFLDRTECFAVDEKWPPKSDAVVGMIAFARRYDNDDIACFMRVGEVTKVVVIHGWTAGGYDIVATYDRFWDWVKSLIDDI